MGNVIKSTSDGMTSQNILVESFETASIFFVSTYNHIIASTDNKGIEANIPPRSELLFDNSDMPTIRMLDMIIFMR
jgi:hypothetical protein